MSQQPGWKSVWCWIYRQYVTCRDMKARLPKPRSQKLRKYMQRETACEPCTDSAHPTGPAISIREHIMPPPHTHTPLHGSLCDSEQKQLTENWQVMHYPPYLWKCTSCHPGDSCSGPLQSFSEFQFSYVSLIRGSNNEVQCKTAIEPKYVPLSLWPPKPTRFSNRQWHKTPDGILQPRQGLGRNQS